jgi:transcription elongation factor GreA
MMSDGKTLSEAATDFLAGLPVNKREEYRQELNKFVRWCGTERSISELSAPEVAKYAESIDGSSANATQRIAPVRSFLSYAKKGKLTPSNLSIHLRVRKITPPKGFQGRPQTETVNITADGYRKIEQELVSLKEERPKIAEAIRKAAADKDFRENAPLDAAKEHQGMVEARIRELEATLKAAVITVEETDKTKVCVGSSVILQDLSHNEELRYIIVNPREASPLKGKLSADSPIGRALLNRIQGEVVEVSAPAGVLKYRIEKIDR